MKKRLAIYIAIITYPLLISCNSSDFKTPDKTIFKVSISESSQSFKLELSNRLNKNYDVYVRNYSGSNTSVRGAFKDDNGDPYSKIEPGKTITTSEIKFGETIHFKIRRNFFGKTPGLNLSFDHLILFQSTQFFLKRGYLNYMLTVDEVQEIVGNHVLGHTCDPDPSKPPGSC